MNPKIVSFHPIKGAGNILGFCGLQVMVHLNNRMIPVTLKAKVARNSQTGHVFVSIHQEAYKKPDGTTGYSNLASFSKETYKEFNEAAENSWTEYMSSQSQAPTSQSPKPSGDAFYPHGMAKNTQPNPAETQVHKQQRQYKQQDEELPF